MFESMRMVGVKEAAKETGLSEWELKRGANAGDYPHIRVGEGRGKFLFDMDMLNETITKKALANTSAGAGRNNIIPFGIRKIQ